MSNLSFDSRLPATAKKPYIDIDDILYPKFVPDYLKPQIEEIESKQQAIRDKYRTGKKPLHWGVNSEYDNLVLKASELYEIVKENYISQRSEGELLDDVRLIVNSFDKEYIESECLWYEGILTDKEAMRGASEAQIKLLKELSTPNFENAYRIIEGQLTFYLEYFNITKPSKKNVDKIDDIVTARVSLWYVKPESSYLPVLKGKATDLAKLAVKSSLIEDKIAHTGTFTVRGDSEPLKATVRKFDEYRAKLGVSTDQLLNVAIANFANNNHIGEGNSRVLKSTEVYISLKDYARARDIEIDIRPTNTPEEKRKEANRAKKALSRAKKRAEEDLEALAVTPLSWEEKVKGKRENFLDVYPVDAKGIKDGYIFLSFSQHFASYLLNLPMNQYPKALLKLDYRQSNAYMIGKKLVSHYFMDSNQLHNRANLLKVKTLLKETDLPTLEEVKAIRKNWVDRIKEPLENALDALGEPHEADNKEGESVERKGCGLLESWEYCHSKGVPLTDKEASALLDSFEVWSETLIKFTLKDTPDQSDRLDKKKQAIEEAKAKKAKKSSADSKKKAE